MFERCLHARPGKVVLLLQVAATVGCQSSGSPASAPPRVAAEANGGANAPSAPRATQRDNASVASRGNASAAPLDNVAGTATGLRCEADASLPQQVDYAEVGPYAVAKLDITFEDSSRPIKKTDTHPAAATRTLVTTIYYPAAAPAPLLGDAAVAGGGPFPMLMYSHGYSSSRDEASVVGNHAASHGYIVVAPDFPLSNLLANGGSPETTDVPNQARDVSFLIDQMLALSEDPQHTLAGAIDEARIGATGVSLGGLTTLLVSFHPKLLDQRIKATVPIAALSAFFMQGFYHTRELPMLLIHGDTDAFVEYKLNSRAAFERAQPNARLMTIVAGTHAAFAVQFDPGTVSLMNLLLGMPGADPTNPDGFGCGGVSGDLSGHVPSLADSLGGPDDFIDSSQVGDSLSACTRDEYTKPAIDSREQVALTASAVVSFFDAHLAQTAATRQDGCRYLTHQLPEDPAVKLE